MKFSVCGFSPEVTIFYLKSYFNISKIYRYDEASHVLMTNRASFDIKDKTTCFNQFEGTDVTVVKRDGLTLSVMRSIKK